MSAFSVNVDRVLVLLHRRTDTVALLKKAIDLGSSGADVVVLYVHQPGERVDRTRVAELRHELAAAHIDFVEVVDDDPTRTAYAFARTHERGTVITSAPYNGGVFSKRRTVNTLLDGAQDLTLSFVPAAGRLPRRPSRRRLMDLPLERRVFGAVLAVVAIPVTTGLLLVSHTLGPLPVVFVSYLPAVVAVTIVGGPLIGILASTGVVLTENYYFVRPRHTLSVGRGSDVVMLGLFLAFSTFVSIGTNRYSTNMRLAQRARDEAEILARAASTTSFSSRDLEPLFRSLAEVFNLSLIELVRTSGPQHEVLISLGSKPKATTTTHVLPVGDHHELRYAGLALTSVDSSLFSIFADRLSAGLEASRLLTTQSELAVLTEVDELRRGLLRAVSHDLRTPLAIIQANVSSLMQDDVEWNARDARRFLTVVDSETRRLTRLVANLLDAGRLEAGAVAAHRDEIDFDDVLINAIESIDTFGAKLAINVSAPLPSVYSDATLLERILANVITNACRFSPPNEEVRITVGVAPNRVLVTVRDRGPGLSSEQLTRVAEPFQRFHDHGAGAGLGLTVATGFASVLGIPLRFEPTNGGGLTVVLEFPSEAQ